MTNFNWPVIGHQPIVNYLQTVIKNQRLNHAYLFYGADGLGKSLVAENFIKSIYCTADNNKPCNKCIYCQQIKNKTYPDIIYIKKEADKKNITIEQIREAKIKIQRSTFLSSYKIVLIPQIHTLSLAASNSLLKILEEPTQQTIFILIAPQLTHIPATILSRVQTIKFLPVATTELDAYLIRQGINRQAAHELSHLAAGFPGHLISLMQTPKFLDEYKNEYRILVDGLSGDINQRFKLVEQIASQANSELARQQTKQFLNNFITIIRDSLLIKNMCFDKIICTYLKEDLAVLATKYSARQLTHILYSARSFSGLIDKNINSRLILENLMLEF